MSAPLVLVTGATGHIGFGVLARLLKDGYQVRVASRRQTAVEKLLQLPSIKPYASSVSFIEVSDFLAEHAFDEAVNGVDYIIHVASPIPDPAHGEKDFSVRTHYIEPAVQGNVGLLKAASLSPSVKRVVITSSVAILRRAPEGESTKVGPDDLAPLLETSEWEDTKSVHTAYAESKKQANDAAEKFIAQQTPHFDVVHTLPGFVQGRNETVTSVEDLRELRVSSNTVMVKYVLGAKDGPLAPTNLVLLDDVAAAHVAALSPKNATSGERFIVTYPEEIPWNTIDPIVKKLFPAEVESGLLPLGETLSGYYVPYDVSKSTEKLGVQFRGPEDMVKSLVGQLVELKHAEAKN